MNALHAQESVQVWKGEELAGVLDRTEQGARFTYDGEFRSKCLAEGHYGVSFTMSPLTQVHEISGVNLHPFFAGLLPEGLRLKALRHSLKVSEDDLFTMLLALGSNCIGDVSVQAQEMAPELEPEEFSNVSFIELFERSIHTSSFRELDPGIPGAMAKISASLLSFPVQLTRRHRQYILKLGSKDHPQLVRNEHLFMLAAKQCGIKAAATSIVVDKNGEEGLLVERFDRTYQRESKRFLRHHLEDACQFLGRYPQDKYRLSLRQIADGISALATGPQIEILRLIELYLFSYLIGNGDLHGKNISLLEDSGGRIRLAPGYDLLSTLPYGDRSMALQLNGKDQSFSATDVLQFGAIFGIPERALRASLNRITSKLAAQIPRFQEIGLPQKKRADLERTCLERINGLLG